MSCNLRRQIVFFLVSLWLLLPVSQVVATTDTGDIVITGSVAPSGSSISTSLTQSYTTTPVHQDDVITYTFSYTSTNPTAVPVTLQVSWDDGLIAGANTPSVDGLEYVLGSASNSNDGTIPVVDTLNRTITWAIANVPANTTNSVTFQLRANASYTGSQLVSFPVLGSVLSPIGVPDETITTYYQYQAPATPNPSSTSSSDAGSATPTPTPSSSPGTTAIISPQISSLRIASIGKNSARIIATTTQPSTVVLAYGTVPELLESNVFAPADQRIHSFVLTNLSADTSYYFTLRLSNTASRTDVFTFRTADERSPEALQTLPTNLIISNQRSVLYAGAPGATAGNTESLVLIRRSVIDLRLEMANSSDIQSVETIIRTPGVLGTSTQFIALDELQSGSTVMSQTSPGIYIGKLKVPNSAGTYEIVGRVEDIYGNISEEVLNTIKVIQPFSVVDEETKQPIADVMVTLSLFNTQTQLYEPISNVSSSIPNPVYTDEDGVLALNLFPGKYEATLHMPGYEHQTIYFEVTPLASANLPLVSMKPLPFGFFTQIIYLYDSFLHVTAKMINVMQELALSRRLVQSSILVTLGTSILLGVASWYIYRHHRFDHFTVLAKAEDSLTRKLTGWIAFVLLHTLRVCGELIIVFWIVLGLLLYAVIGNTQGLIILFLTGVIMLLWTYDATILAQRRRDEQTT